MEIKFLNGDVFVPKILGGVSNPNNPPLFTPLAQTIKWSNFFKNGQHSPIKGVKSFNSKVYESNIELSRS